MTKNSAGDFDKVIKLVAVGDGGVGKTSLIRRWAENKFEKTYLKTLGVDITDKSISYKDKKIKMVVWDLAGQESYKTYRSAFYKGTEAIMIVADVTNPATFDNLTNWRDEISNFVGIKVPTIFLANKCDLVGIRTVERNQILAIGKHLGLNQDQIFETSALEGTNVKEAFEKLAKQALE
jgi:small GTP-binding protein